MSRATRPLSLAASLRRRLAALSGVLLLTACAATPGRRDALEPAEVPAAGAFGAQTASDPIAAYRAEERRWHVGQALLQGFLGVSQATDVEVEGSGAGATTGDDDFDALPVIGGGAQWKLAGRRVDLGLEAMLAFSGRADAEAFAVGGGGAVVAVDVDLLVFELFGGPFASLPLGERARVYAAAGPVMQWADWDQSGAGLDDDGSGFGYGYYARTGVELALSSRTLIGVGVRWSDTQADLGGSLGDLDIDGLQVVVTVSKF